MRWQEQFANCKDLTSVDFSGLLNLQTIGGVRRAA